MTEHANPGDKGLRILLEALTTISYMRGEDGRAAAVAEFALDQFERTLRYVGHEGDAAELPYLPGLCPDKRNYLVRQRVNDRRSINSGPPPGVAERRFGTDRRLNPDRRHESRI